MTKQEAYGFYYAITKLNYYLQGADIIARNDHKPLTNFLKWEKCKQQGKQMGT